MSEGGTEGRTGGRRRGFEGRAWIVGALLAAAVAEAGGEQSGQVVARANHTSAYDAFLAVNRIPAAPGQEEPAKVYAGRALNRIENMTARRILKRPSAFTPEAFEGWRIFMRTEERTRNGNCVACHVPPEFTDGLRHNIGVAQAARAGEKGGGPVASAGEEGKFETPSLRRLEADKPYMHNGAFATLEEAMAEILRNSRLAREGKIGGVDPEYKNVRISEEDVGPLIAFLKSLHEVGREGYREYLLNVELHVPEQDR
jgi:hypothetical protein